MIASNRKARHDYAILDTFEAGHRADRHRGQVAAAGPGVAGRRVRQDDDGELFLHGMHIPEYTQGTWTNHEPRRIRKLLLNRGEIERLIGKTRGAGLTLVPLSIYFNDGWAKVELGLAAGKKTTTSARTWPSATPTARSRGPTGARRRAARGPRGERAVPQYFLGDPG